MSTESQGDRVIKVIGCTTYPGVPDLDVLRARGGPIANVDTGSIGTVISSITERTMGSIEATAWVEQWWRDESAFLAWFQSEVTAASGSGDTYWLTTEHVLRTPAIGSGAIKLVGTAYRRPDFTTEAFFRYWREVHGPISGIAPGLGGYVVTEVIRRLVGDLEADGFVEQWWPDAPTLAAANASREVAVAWADVENYALTTGTFWLTRERVIQSPHLPLGSLETQH